ncbi:unnamed protein product [Linum tenue]|uniref:Uncharacterized protein n=1 Tax=Linum tenue TaxID=586396 RepID=A0AAV0PIJ0_9ROSI|nr:unnamed protein product [Linum tenue]
MMMTRWRRYCGEAVSVGSRSWKLTSTVRSGSKVCSYPIPSTLGRELWGIGRTT